MNEIKQTNERVILHVDANNFYASVECLSHPEYRQLPLAVTGNPEKRTGIILAKNEIAKKCGVKTGQTIGEAMSLCPSLVCLAPHHELYEEISQKLHEIYLEYTNFVEPLGVDECWLDVTGCHYYLGKNELHIANEIRERIKREIGITVSVGVSFSKIFAKLGSDLKKPDATTVISRENFKLLTYHLPLNSIIGIGRRLDKKFSSISVYTIGDFVMLDDHYLDSVMGINGTNLKQELLGRRLPSVLDYYSLPPPKSIGNGTTTIKDISKKKDIEKVIAFLAQKVSTRMIKHGVKGDTISLSLKSSNLSTVHKSHKILPTNEVKDILREAIALCDSIFKYNYPIRAIRLKMSGLTDAHISQLSIFDKPKKDFSKVMNEINSKYGKIFLASDKASFINNPDKEEE